MTVSLRDFASKALESNRIRFADIRRLHRDVVQDAEQRWSLAWLSVGRTAPLARRDRHRHYGWDGEDLRSLPLLACRRQLQVLLESAGPALRLSEHKKARTARRCSVMPASSG